MEARQSTLCPERRDIGMCDWYSAAANYFILRLRPSRSTRMIASSATYQLRCTRSPLLASWAAPSRLLISIMASPGHYESCHNDPFSRQMAPLLRWAGRRSGKAGGFLSSAEEARAGSSCSMIGGSILRSATSDRSDRQAGTEWRRSVCWYGSLRP